MKRSDSLTLDTNVVRELLDDQAKAAIVVRLLRLANEGDVELAVTARIGADVPLPPLAERLADLPALGITTIGTVARLGLWVLGRDVLGSDAFLGWQEEVSSEITRRGRRPPDWRDWDHLHAHVVQRRDFFLTWDARVLEAGELLAERIPVQVLRPEEYLALRKERATAC